MKPKCTITQGFGENANNSYSSAGLRGHTGIDSDCGFGTPVHSYWKNEYVYKVLTKERPSNDGTGFTGIFTIVEQDGEVFEFLYGHCNPSVTVGQNLTQGMVIGTQANNGEVYSNGIRITLEMQKAGDIRGTHRHDQKRPLRKDTYVKSGQVYISSPEGGILKKDGFYYAYLYPTNGYGGCVDWTKNESVSPRSEPFMDMQRAILAFQLSEGLADFKDSPLTEVAFGTKTKRAANKYMTKNKYRL